MIWIIFAIMTAIVIAVLILAGGAREAASPDLDRNAFDRAVFRDQLAELDRDVERGMIGLARRKLPVTKSPAA
jgi:cytochrome c-type biogenesis protein CcmH